MTDFALESSVQSFLWLLLAVFACLLVACTTNCFTLALPTAVPAGYHTRCPLSLPALSPLLRAQPITRTVFSKAIVRPHVHAKERVVPVYKQQDVLVPKVEERTIVKEEFQQQQQTMPTVTEQTTYAGKQRDQLYPGAGLF